MKNKTKWFWKMNYCKENSLAPAKKEAWDEAEREYNKQHIERKIYKIE